MKTLQEGLLNFLKDDDKEEENYENLIKCIIDEKIKEDKYALKTFLYLLSKIAKNHYRSHNFINKIEQIVKEIKSSIKKFYSNSEIFKIFKSNKRILLFLIEEEIITIDKYIYNQMNERNFTRKFYLEYFSPEIKSFIENNKSANHKNEDDYLSSEYEEEEIFETNKDLKEDFELFNKKRKIGENDGSLYELIREDSIEKFIIYVNKENYPLNSFVGDSIYESNSLLMQKKVTLIEYAAFFGSIQIFRYLYKNGVKLTQSIWIYAIHGLDEEIIHILEDHNLWPKVFYSKDLDYSDDNNIISIEDCLKESIKCHHNEVVNYIENNIIIEKALKRIMNEYCFHYFNFIYFPKEIKSNRLINYACKYDDYKIVELVFNTVRIDLRNDEI